MITSIIVDGDNVSLIDPEQFRRTLTSILQVNLNSRMSIYTNNKSAIPSACNHSYSNISYHLTDSGKSSADIAIAVDATRMVCESQDKRLVVIVSSDRDYHYLVSSLSSDNVSFVLVFDTTHLHNMMATSARCLHISAVLCSINEHKYGKVLADHLVKYVKSYMEVKIPRDLSGRYCSYLKQYLPIIANMNLPNDPYDLISCITPYEDVTRVKLLGTKTSGSAFTRIDEVCELGYEFRQAVNYVLHENLGSSVCGNDSPPRAVDRLIEVKNNSWNATQEKSGDKKCVLPAEPHVNNTRSSNMMITQQPYHSRSCATQTRPSVNNVRNSNTIVAPHSYRSRSCGIQGRPELNSSNTLSRVSTARPRPESHHSKTVSRVGTARPRPESHHSKTVSRVGTAQPESRRPKVVSRVSAAQPQLRHADTFSSQLRAHDDNYQLTPNTVTSSYSTSILSDIDILMNPPTSNLSPAEVHEINNQFNIMTLGLDVSETFSRSGPDHCPKFNCTITITDESHTKSEFHGTSTSKKDAKTLAKISALNQQHLK